MKKIAIITTYHGKFPNYIDLWIESVGNNPTVDFFLFTDLPVLDPPCNLIIINKSFEELVKLAQKNFDFPIVCSRPYKFPDFRPAFGEIFHDYLKDYDFWGYSEHDMIYGDIRKFLTDDIFDKYDRILGNGHLSFYKNTEECNSRYKDVTSPDYEFVYTCDRNFYFEEYGGTSKYWDENFKKIFFQNRDILSDVRPLDYTFNRNEDKGKGITNVIFSYEDGKVFRIYIRNGAIHKEETLYMHFQKRKLQYKKGLHGRYMVVPNKFIDFIPDLTIDNLKRLTPQKIFYKQAFRIIKNKWKEKIIWNFKLKVLKVKV